MTNLKIKLDVNVQPNLILLVLKPGSKWLSEANCPETKEWKIAQHG